MRIKVHMLAFMDGDIREVNVPRISLKGDVVEAGDLGMEEDDLLAQAIIDAVGPRKKMDIHEVLETVYHFGQNEFQVSGRNCSVSVGDVVELDGRYWRVEPMGFKELSPVQYDNYISIPKADRAIRAYMGD